MVEREPAKFIAAEDIRAGSYAYVVPDTGKVANATASKTQGAVFTAPHDVREGEVLTIRFNPNCLT